MKVVLVSILISIVIFFASFGIVALILGVGSDEVEKNYKGSFFIHEAKIKRVSDPIKVGHRLEEMNKKHQFNRNEVWVTGTSLSKRIGDCTIWAYEPRNRWDTVYMENLGHEVLHCFRGSFHE